MRQLNQFTSTVPVSGIRTIFEMSFCKDNCIHLEIGEPDFDTPEHIREAMAKASIDGFTKYQSNYGMMELREAIAKKVTEKNGFSIGPENVVISAGGLCCLFLSFLMTVECGDEVLLPEPGWPNYLLQMSCIGAKGVPYRLDPQNGFRIDFDALESLVTPKTKAILVNSPSNPAGVVFPREDIQRIAEFVKRHDLYLVSDEVYEDIVFDGEHISCNQYTDIERTASVFSFSKTYAMTGLRVGYVVCDAEMADRMAKIHEGIISCATSISQIGALAALNGPQDVIGVMVERYKARCDAAVAVLKEKGLYQYTPGGAFHTLVDISSAGMNSMDFALELLREKNVAVAPGNAFGPTIDPFVRICFANDVDKITEGVTILCDFIHEKSGK